jgi:hypothetical protein
MQEGRVAQRESKENADESCIAIAAVYLMGTVPEWGLTVGEWNSGVTVLTR